MKTAIYTDAVKDLTVKALSEFLGTVDKIIEIDDWSTFRAPAKRDVFIEALGQSPEMREAFVAFYSTNTGSPQTFAEWEDENAAAPVAETEVFDPPSGESEPEPAKAKAKAKAKPVIQEAEIVDETDEHIDVAIADSAIETGTGLMTPFVGSFVEGAFEQIVSDAAGLTAEQSTVALKSVEEDLEFQHIRIGVLLGHISKSEHYMALGYENMRGFLQAETGMDYRKAMYLIKNAEVIQELNIPAIELKGVSWSGLRHILPIINAANYKEWLDAASSMKHVTLIAKVNEEKLKLAGGLAAPETTETGEEKPKPTQKVFNIYDDQKELINQAIDKAKIEGNTDSSGAALEIIAASYTGAPATNSTVAQVKPDLTPEGLGIMFAQIQADEGENGCVRILEVIDEIWPNVSIAVEFNEATEAA